jgi:hypothetical protein
MYHVYDNGKKPLRDNVMVAILIAAGLAAIAAAVLTIANY